MKAAALLTLAGLALAPLAQAESQVPYRNVAPMLTIAEVAQIDGRRCGKAYLHFKNPADAVDPKRANFRLSTASGEVIPLRVEKLAEPRKGLKAECTHVVWIPTDAKKFADAVLIHDLERGAVIADIVGDLKDPSVVKALGLPRKAQEDLFGALLVLNTTESLFGPQHRQTLLAAMKVGAVTGQYGLFWAGEPYVRQAVEGLEKLGSPEEKHLLEAQSMLAIILKGEGREQDAEPLLRKVVEGYEKLLGPSDGATLFQVNILANSLMRQKKHSEAEPLLQRVVSNTDPSNPRDYKSVVNCHLALAQVHSEKKQVADAERHARAAMELASKGLGQKDDMTLNAKEQLATILAERGDRAAAADIIREMVATFESSPGDARLAAAKEALRKLEAK